MAPPARTTPGSDSRRIIATPPPPDSTGKTSICNYLGDTAENAIGNNRPTKGVRIVEFTADGVPAKNKSSPKTEIELWDCSGDSAYEECWPAFRHSADGIIFVYTGNTSDQRQILASMYNFFVESSGIPEGNCLVMLNSSEEPRRGEESPLDGIRHVAVHLGTKNHELRKIFNSFLRNIKK